MNKAEVKAKLMAEAEANIDRMLDKATPKQPMKMREIVALALESEREMETAIMTTLSHAPGEHDPATVLCEQCGSAMHYKGRRKRDIVTQAGETRLERAYYYCARCKVGRFPPR